MDLDFNNYKDDLLLNNQKKSKKKHNFFDVFIYGILIVFFACIVFSWEYENRDFFTVLSFFVNGAIYLYFIMTSKESVTLRRNIYIFMFIFFFFAPLEQYLTDTVLWKENGIHIQYTDSDYFKCNLILICFVGAFEWGYRKKLCPFKQKGAVFEKSTNLHLILILFVSVFSFVGAYIINKLIPATSDAITAQIRNVLLFAPCSCLLLTLSIKDKRKIDKIVICVEIIIMLVSIIMISGNTARFLLLGAVMTIISYIMKYTARKSLYFLGYIFGFFFMFSVIRKTDLLSGPLIGFVDFVHVDYDAYQIMLCTIKYVEKEGISWGMNLLSTITCFIPREFAKWRLESTGGIVINYLGSWFKNVSCPIQAEMFFAFGVPGIFILSYLFGLLIKKLDMTDIKSGGFWSGLYCIISGVSIYLMRGSLLPTFSFTVGLVISYYILFKFINMRTKAQ